MSNYAKRSLLQFEHPKRFPSTRCTSVERPIAATNAFPVNPVIQRRAACVCGGGCPDCQGSVPIQARLNIGRPNDSHEQEADRIADRVVDMPTGGIQGQAEEAEEETLQMTLMAGQIAPLVQRQVEEEDENETLQAKLLPGMVHRQADVEAEEAELQTKTAGINPRKVPAGVDYGIQTLRGGGRRLPEPMRLFFESRFGQKFGQVRVHTDGRAAGLARAVNARAFTRGKDIVFASGQYAPATKEGKRLLAHELTHVVQQTGPDVIFRAPGNPVISTRERQQLLRAIRTKIAQINGALTRGYAWSAETYRNGIIEVGLLGMRFPVAHRNLYLLRLRRYLEELRSRVRANNVPDPATHPTGAHNYVTRPFELQWLVSHYLEELGITDPAFDMYISYTEFNPNPTPVLPRVSGVVRPFNIGRYIVVADPVRRPTDVELLDPFRRQRGVILDLWEEAGVYFYYYRGRKHYLPDFRLH